MWPRESAIPASIVNFRPWDEIKSLDQSRDEIVWLAKMSWHAGDATLLGERGVLLVTAHPDDEAMFFVPTLLALQARGVAVHVLCLSTGSATSQC